MGTRQSSFKKGGGFLNGVDGTITDYRFTDEFNGELYKPKKYKDAKTGKLSDLPHSLNAFLSVRVDGADEDTTTTLRVASKFEDWEISNDGHTLTPTEDANLGSSSAWGKFIQSWEIAADQGAESDEYGDNVFNFTPIIGSRVRLVQRPYNADELDNLKRLGAPIKRKGKDGKEYNRQSLVVDQVYELASPEVKANGKTAKPGKAIDPSKSAKASSVTAKAKIEPETEDVKDLAGRALLEILDTTAGGTIAKVKLSLKTLLTPVLKGHPQRDDVRKWIAQDDNLAELAEEGLITYNKATQIVEIAAA